MTTETEVAAKNALDIAREFMLGELMQAAMKQLRSIDKPYLRLPENHPRGRGGLPEGDKARRRDHCFGRSHAVPGDRGASHVQGWRQGCSDDGEHGSESRAGRYCRRLGARRDRRSLPLPARVRRETGVRFRAGAASALVISYALFKTSKAGRSPAFFYWFVMTEPS